VLACERKWGAYVWTSFRYFLVLLSSSNSSSIEKLDGQGPMIWRTLLRLLLNKQQIRGLCEGLNPWCNTSPQRGAPCVQVASSDFKSCSARKRPSSSSLPRCYVETPVALVKKMRRGMLGKRIPQTNDDIAATSRCCSSDTTTATSNSRDTPVPRSAALPWASMTAHSMLHGRDNVTAGQGCRQPS
jgi:hypothetical protein